MTKKAVRQRKREQDPFYRPKPAEKPLHVGKGDHCLDEGQLVIGRDQNGKPKRGLAGLGDPRRSDAVMSALAIINIALAREDATVLVPQLTPEEGEDIHDAFVVAGLRPQEARAWELYSEGYGVPQIAERMDLKQPTHSRDGERLTAKAVEEYLRRGRAKLKVWADRHR